MCGNHDRNAAVIRSSHEQILLVFCSNRKTILFIVFSLPFISNVSLFLYFTVRKMSGNYASR